MVVGTESKEKQTITRGGRRVVGEKGVGRFSTEKLARRVTIISNPKGKEEKITLKINWDEYENDGIKFDEIQNPIFIEQRQKSDRPGVEIILENLRDRWSEYKLIQLKNEIGTLVMPQGLAEENQNFIVNITSSEFNLKAKKVESSLLKKAPFRMKATTINSYLHCVIYDGKNRDEREPHKFKIKPLCGPISFELFVFPQDAAGESRWTRYYEDVLKSTRVTDLLENYSGVRIYRDGFWVKPYGGRGNDWLELDKMRVARRNRVGNNQVIGFVKISRDQNPEIKDTTTREKIIENEAFNHMKMIVIQAIKEFNAFREEVRINQKQLETTAPKDQLAVSNIEHSKKLINSLDIPNSTKKDLLEAQSRIASNMKAYSEAKEEEIEKKSVAIESQTSLVTIGLATAYIAHEVIRPLGNSLTLINSLSSIGEKNHYSQIKNQIELLRSNIEKLLHFMSFVENYTSMISGSIDDKWSKTDVQISELFKRLETGFSKVLNELKISTSFHETPENIIININPVDLESIFTNLLTNAIKSLQLVKENRMIKIECSITPEHFVLEFSDSGKGVDPSIRDRIFDPLFSTYKFTNGKVHGTGLGLPIIRTILNKYNGTIEVASEGKYNHGATFVIKIPLDEAVPVVS
jgi:signal transduction histidine kinase